jgi:hypothetical protein
MTIAEAQLADISMAIAWTLAALVTVLGSKAKALWCNVLTSSIVGGVTIASIVETLFRRYYLSAMVQQRPNTVVWTVSYASQLLIDSAILALALAAILLSLSRSRSGQHRFWAGWLLNAPSVSLAVFGLLATSLK